MAPCGESVPGAPTGLSNGRMRSRWCRGADRLERVQPRYRCSQMASTTPGRRGPRRRTRWTRLDSLLGLERTRAAPFESCSRRSVRARAAAAARRDRGRTTSRRVHERRYGCTRRDLDERESRAGGRVGGRRRARRATIDPGRRTRRVADADLTRAAPVPRGRSSATTGRPDSAGRRRRTRSRRDRPDQRRTARRPAVSPARPSFAGDPNGASASTWRSGEPARSLRRPWSSSTSSRISSGSWRAATGTPGGRPPRSRRRARPLVPPGRVGRGTELVGSPRGPPPRPGRRRTRLPAPPREVSLAAAFAWPAAVRASAHGIAPRAHARPRSIARRGRSSPGRACSKWCSTCCAQSAAHTASSR